MIRDSTLVEKKNLKLTVYLYHLLSTVPPEGTYCVFSICAGLHGVDQRDGSSQGGETKRRECMVVVWYSGTLLVQVVPGTHSYRKYLRDGTILQVLL